MAQNVVDFSGNPSGSGLMDDYLDKDQQNVLTSNSGIQRPSYAVAGTKWLDTSVTPWLWKMYDGSSDIMLGTVNPLTHLFTPAGVLPSQDGQSGKFLQTNGSNTVWTDAVDYTNITNCITAIPQDIKLELADKKLYLSIGSKVYDGNGLLKTITEQTNQNYNITAGTRLFLYEIERNTIVSFSANRLASGDSLPADNTNCDIFYLTSDKKVYRYLNSVWSANAGYSFPICIATTDGVGVISIDQVFNGFGYIGNTIFALPGVEGLVPNEFIGKSRNNIKTATNKVSIFTLTNNVTNFAIGTDGLICPRTYFGENLGANTVPPSGNFGCFYDSKDNIIYYNSAGKWTKDTIVLCGDMTSDSTGRITSFNPKTIFQAADYQDVPKLATDNTFTGVNTFGEIIPNAVNFKNKTGGGNAGFLYQNTAGYLFLGLRNSNNTEFQNNFSFLPDGSIQVNFGNSATNKSFTVPTPATTDNSTKAATTAFVNNFFNTAGKITGKCVPNYRAGVGIALDTNYSAPKDGVVVMANKYENFNDATVTIDGAVVYRSQGNGYSTTSMNEALVGKGSVVRGTGTLSVLTFYPLKGA